MITKESLMVLKTSINFASKVNRQYDNKFAVKGAKIGDSISIRKPPKFTVTSGAAINIQDVTDESKTLTLDTQNHVAFQFSSKEFALNIEEFSDRYIRPAIAPLAAEIDYDGLTKYKKVYNSVGTPGTTPAAFSLFTDAKAYLNRAGVPKNMQKSVVINSVAESSMVDTLKGLFQSSEKIAEQYENGTMGIAAGLHWMCDEHVNQHTVGAYAGTPLVDGASQTGATLVTDGWTSGSSTLNEGDVFTIANVFSVNPQTKQSTGVLQQFVVTAQISDTSGAKTIAISPSITTSGSGQTVNASPADNAAITVVGAASTATPQNIAYHRDAFCLGMADLPLPDGTDQASRAVDEDGGFSVRIVRDYDINTDKFPCRVDVLYGWTELYPEWAVRIQG